MGQRGVDNLVITDFSLADSGYVGSRGYVGSAGPTGSLGYIGSAGTGSDNPSISTITYPGDDTAADTAGGQTITLTGTNFAAGATIIINNITVSVVSVVNSTTITFTAPAMTAGSYIVYVINTDGKVALAVPGIQYSGVPTWSTSAGSLGTSNTQTSFTANLIATGDAPITYSVTSGALPSGITLTANTGILSGTTPNVASSTTYNFTIRATDAQRQDTDRAFGITVLPLTVAQFTGITYSVSATYSSNSPPTYQYMNDNNANGQTNGSQWGSSSTSFEFIKADLGSTNTVTKIVIGYDYLANLPGGWGTVYTENKTIEISTDNTNWTTMGVTPTYASTGSTNGLVTINFPTNSYARYIRLSGSSWLAVLELQAWGYTGIVTTPTNTPSTVEYLVVAGGGGGGYTGAGGAGGFRTGNLVITGSSLTVIVGGGGNGSTSGPSDGSSGSNSAIGSITSAGGGYGGGVTTTGAGSGGSGGGSCYSSSATVPNTAGTGNTPTTSPSQGNNGGGGLNGSVDGAGGGGGGAGAAGSNSSPISTSPRGGNGGAGLVSSISGSSTYYAGGGGGGGYNASAGGNGGAGGGGGGGSGSSTQGTGSNGGNNGSSTVGGSGGTNSGGGGGGGPYGGGYRGGGSGGSGVVIVRYADTYQAASTTGTPTITVAGGYRVYKWTTSGSITF